MRFEENDEELVFYNEAEEPEVKPEPEDINLRDADLERLADNPFVSQAEFDRLAGDRAGIRKRQQATRDRERAERRKTNRLVGSFWLDALCMFTFSPYKFSAGRKTFSEFIRLGAYIPDKYGNLPDEVECDIMYQQKKLLFYKNLFNKDSLIMMALELAAFLLAVWGMKYGIAQLRAGHWGLWSLFILIVAIIVCWNVIKTFLRSMLKAMRDTCDKIAKDKEDADKAKKAQLAQQEARRKAQEKERREAMRRQTPAPTEEDHSEEPIRPSGRGRYRRSGG